MEEKVSVIIPTYKRPYMLGNAIDSVLNQTYKNIEILIVDDNNPESLERAETENFIEKYSADHRIKYVKHENNKGGCAARNTGILMSEGSYIAFLDDDDYWMNNFLESVMRMYKKLEPETGAIYCDSYVALNGKIYAPKNNGELKKGELYEVLLSGWCPGSTSFFVIRKECFDRVGLFDEKLQSFQDYDMWLRISQRYGFDFINEKLVIKYEHGGEQVSINPYRRQAGLDTLKEKWIPKLTVDQNLQFNSFINFHQSEIFKNLIIYNKSKKKKEKYMNYLKKYIVLSKDSLIHPTILFMVIIFGVKILDYYNSLKLVLFKNRYYFYEME